MAETLEQIYAGTCLTYSKVANNEQFKAWASVLGGTRPAIVRKAADLHFGDTTLDLFTKKIRGSFMPTPAEIKALAQQIEAEERSANTVKFVDCTDQPCSNGWHVEERGAVRCPRFLEWVRRNGRNIQG